MCVSLHTALIMKQEETVKSLVDSGVNLDTRNEVGRTPLYYAYKYNDSNMCEYLLVNGASINIKVDNNYTLLHMAVERRDENFVKLLLERGADVNVLTNSHSTPLHLSCKIGSEYITKLLLKHNADLHAKDDKGSTALHVAVKENNEKMVKLLLRKGSHIGIVTNSMSTALHFAAAYNSEENILLRLIKFGADVTAEDVNKKTALCYAVSVGDVRKVRIFLDNNPDISDKSNKLAFCLAILENHSKIVDIFLLRDFTLNSQDFNVIHIPEPYNSKYSKNCDREEFERISLGLLRRRPSINAFFEYKVLYTCVERGYVKVFNGLLQDGVDLDTLLEGNCTLLHVAVKNAQLWIVEELLKRGANINAVDIRGRTPVHLSVLDNATDITALLLKYGVNIEIKDQDDEAPLHIAAERGHKNIVELLLDFDAEINIKNRNSKTPLDLAMYYQKEDVVRILLEHDGLFDHSTCYSEDFHELKMTHLIRKQAIAANVLEIDPDYTLYALNCVKELQKLYEKELVPQFTLFDILVRNDLTLQMFVRNEIVHKYLESLDYDEFPIYANRMRIRVHAAKKRNELIDLSIMALESLVPIEIPYTIIKEILCYVHNKDLRNVIFASEL